MKRRTFLQTLSATTAASAGMIETGKATTPTKKFSANDKIRIGAIGMGIIGFINMDNMIQVPGVEFVAAADVYDSRLTRVKEIYGNAVDTTRDYREILNRSDIDAVIINTPDHWHAQMAIDAMQAGKHVHVEKPMVQHIEDGLRVLNTQKETGKVLQVGSKQFRDPTLEKAKQLIQEGSIGQLTIVESQVSRNNGNGAWQYSIPTDASPKTIDWDLFLGNAPKRAFDADRFFRWRKYWDYGTGVSGDMFVHRMTGLHYVLDALGPTQVMASGGVRYWNDGREAPDVINALLEYPETAKHDAFTLILKANFADGSGGSYDYRFVGSDGVIQVKWGKLTMSGSKRWSPTTKDLVEGYNSVRTFSKAQQAAFTQEHEKYGKEITKLPTKDAIENVDFTAPRLNERIAHYTHFTDVIRNGGTIYEDAAYGFRACAPTLLANLSSQNGQAYRWDPYHMKVVGAEG
ncbi:MAG: Gfo/Idh/MocA family oxidoreductase [Bacteroidota bacterium]